MDSSPDFYITDNKGLKRVTTLILKERTVAIDTEFTRERTYYPILSLIQIAVRRRGKIHLFIIDCLADIDLEPIFKIMANEKVTKIFHSSLQDLQIFYQKSKQLPQSVSDTQIMANFCNIDFNIGYSALVEHFLGKKIDKSQQRSNWQKRPLSQKQIEYALSDVLYLEEIHDKLLQILDEKNRRTWYIEEVIKFAQRDIIKPDENLLKNLNYRKKTPEQIRQVQQLTLWREKKVKKLDIPRQFLIRDEAIEKIVVFNDLRLKLKPSMIKEIKAIIDYDASPQEIEAARKAAQINPLMTSRQKRVFKDAKLIIADTALKEELKEQLLITGPALKSLIHGHYHIDDLLSGWRLELFGKKLKKLRI